jgi:murein DD-endopeptidase MepM/ murein hydrolase activator NlpD
MAFNRLTAQTGRWERAREMFQSRDLFFHDGKTMRRVHLSTRMQLMAAAGVAFAGLSAVAGVAGVAMSAPGVSQNINQYAARHAAVSEMEGRVAALQAEVDTIRQAARVHAARLEKRQAFLANIVSGKGDAQEVSSLMDGAAVPTDKQSASILAAFNAVEVQQQQAAQKLLAVTESRYREKYAALSHLGIDPRRVQLAMGGPYEPVTVETAAALPAATVKQEDQQFRALFNSWKRLDQLEQGMVSIPSAKPVQTVALTSNFGVRSDPFRGGAAMHSGVDIPGSYGTPIYATADAIVGRAGWIGGYGNMVELEHGRGIQTRYGHMSQLLVAAGTRVKRGQQIGLMGSTGRSTGNHLHYEVRLDGRAVNPIPFLRSTDYMVAMQRRNDATQTALGGPAKGE